MKGPEKENKGSSPTRGVEMLLGDPKAAIRSISGPMMVAMLVMTLYNVADAFWVSGLGPDALAAIGFVFPFFFLFIGFANGIGVGGGSAVARAIGAHDRGRAERIAQHTLIIMVVVAFAVSVPLLLTANTVFSLLGAGTAAAPAAEYGSIIYLGALFLFFSLVANALFRGEGDATRPMYAMALTSVANILLDPLFIYGFGMGIAGAAWASVLSMIASSAIMLYWMVVKKDTYLSYSFRGFSYDPTITREILNVGLPASVEQVSMAVRTLFVNGIIVIVAGSAGVAVASVGLRVVSIAVTPLIAISSAVVPVAGAAFGARMYAKMDVAHRYSIKTGFVIAVCLSALTFLFSSQIAALFTMSVSTEVLTSDIVTFLMIMCLFYPGVPFGMFSVSLLQGAGRGMQALLITVLRAVLFNVLFAWIFAVSLGMGLAGVWWGIVAGDIIGDTIGFIWTRFFIRALIREAGS
jgi:putative MATE family efflux protein